MEPPPDDGITPERLNKLLTDLHEVADNAARLDEAAKSVIVEAFVDQALESPAQLNSTAPVDALAPLVLEEEE